MINMKSLWGLTIATVCISHIIHASPVPDPVVHSLATYATTNSFHFTNKLGTLNYRFSKPQLAQAQTFTKLVGLPFQRSLFSATGHLYTSANPSQASFEETSQNLVSNGETKTVSKDISTFLVPPELGSQFTPFITGIVTKTDVHQQDSTGNSELSLDNSENTEENLKADSVSGRDFDHSIDHNEPPNTENNYPVKTVLNKSEENSEDANSELGKLFNKVINAQFHRAVPVDNDNHDFSRIDEQQTETDTKTAQIPMQSRQDSNIEQPLSFFPSDTDKTLPTQEITSQPGPRLQFPPLLTGNQRFALPSNSKQANQPNQFSQLPQFQPGLFPGPNRFASPQNSVSQPTTLNSPLSPQFMPHLPQFMPGSNNALPAGQPGFQYPGFNNAPPPGGAPPPEPENGYNPFHLSERFPEPPYESEFTNDVPDEAVDSLEQRQRSFGRDDDTSPPQVLDFAQSTLRNVRTEELLDVVKRKPVPPACVYNTISYGVNGEDCIEFRKRKK